MRGINRCLTPRDAMCTAMASIDARSVAYLHQHAKCTVMAAEGQSIIQDFLKLGDNLVTLKLRVTKMLSWAALIYSRRFV